MFSLLESFHILGSRWSVILTSPVVKLRGDPTQAFEAVLNLCTNAMQAMPDGGTCACGSNARTGTPLALSHSLLEAGCHIALSVSDQGTGIDAVAMERLFGSFFTTRDERSGTGLGLAVVHGVVGEFRGAIDVQSAPGKGARFTVYFPECTETLAPQNPLPVIDFVPGGKRLMVIDDEPALVMLTEEILGELGYEPVGYNDPVAALAALRQDPNNLLRSSPTRSCRSFAEPGLPRHCAQARPTCRYC